MRACAYAGLWIGKVRMEKKTTPLNKRHAAAIAATVDHHCKEDAYACHNGILCDHRMQATVDGVHVLGIKGSRFLHNQHSCILKLVLNNSIFCSSVR